MRKMCSVKECEDRVHARGYCRKHYGQIWRKGKIAAAPASANPGAPVPARDDSDRLRTLQRELRKAEQMYEVVVGFEGRMKWRREMEAVKSEIGEIQPTVAAHGRARAEKAQL